MGGKGGGGKKGGGGGGAITVDVTSNSVVDSDSTNTLNSNSTNTIDTNASAQLQIVGLDNVSVKTDTESDARSDIKLAITEPIRTDSKNLLDIRPLQADFCLKVGIERLPFTKVCKPVERHFAITVFGTEVVGFNYSAEERTYIEDRRQTFVVQDRPYAKYEATGRQKAHRVEEDEGGLRIRLGDVD